MRLSLQRLLEIESRLSGRVMLLDSLGYVDRADLIDSARRRVQRVRELRQLAASTESEAA